MAIRPTVLEILPSVLKYRTNRLTFSRVTLQAGTKTISFHPAHYSIHFLSSTHSLIHSSISLSLKKIIHLSAISSFHSSSSSFPSYYPIPASLSSCLHASFPSLNISARRCPIPLAETSRCILQSSVFSLVQKTCRLTS